MTPPQLPPCSHANALEPYFAAGETDFVRCTRCGLVLRQPMPTPAELDAIYAALYGDTQISRGQTNQESGSYALQQYAAYLVSALLWQGRRVLDYGCGSGLLVEELRKRGVEAIGLETSAEARLYCQQQRGLTLSAGLGEVPDASLDAVSMIEVIEHLVDPQLVLEQLRSRLRPGGVLFVTTPNRCSLRARAEGGHWREATKKFHVVLFDAQSLQQLLAAAGYVDVQRVRYPPVQRAGALRWLFTRAQQAFGLAGTLCFIARTSSL